jgi:hypothetical protein
MRKVIAFEWMSLDGVVQAPAFPGEDMCRVALESRNLRIRVGLQQLNPGRS